MKKLRFTLNTLAFTLVFFAFTSLVNAQATRTWVSGVGDDVNPCSRTAPCKTFAGAISKTATGGEIDVLDPGGFGTLNVTKSITIDGAGAMASTLASGGINGFIINAPSTATVILRNLSINGTGTTLGLNGIRILSAKNVIIENCSIFNFSNNGIDINPTVPVHVTVTNVTVNNNGSYGLSARSSSSANKPSVFIDRGRFVNNLIGVYASDNANITCVNCFASNNASFGYAAQPFTAGTTAEVNLENSVAANHKSQSFSGGVYSGNGGAGTAILRMTNVSIFNNLFGFSIDTGGTIRSFGNNKIDGNPSGNVGSLTPVAQQ